MTTLQSPSIAAPPPCPKCGGQMRQRNSARGPFWGCGKKAVLRGKDLSGQIRDMIEGFGAQTIEELGDLLMRYRIAESERLENAGKSAQVVTAHEDRCDTLSVLMEGCANLLELDQKISRIFDDKDEEGAIVLSSVHGSKGLEAETIFLLKPELMPHPKAEREEDLEQENNIRYVALTRSKNRLVFVYDSSKTAAPEPEQEELFDDPFGEDFDGCDGDCGTEDHGFDSVETTAAADAPEEQDSVRDQLWAILSPKAPDWRDRARTVLATLYDDAPFDAPDAYFEAIKQAQEALPRGS